MSLNFPNNPTDEQTFEVKDPARTWIYSSAKARWELISDRFMSFGADAPVQIESTDSASVTYGYDLEDLPNT